MKALSISWALLIVVLCSIPGSSVPDVALFSLDKVGHFGMFFIGAILWVRTWPERAGWIFAAGIVFSVGTELYQGSLPMLGRSADPYDVLADLVGLALGFGLALWLDRRVPVA